MGRTNDNPGRYKNNLRVSLVVHKEDMENYIIYDERNW